MKIKVETPNDRLVSEQGKIKAFVQNKEYCFDTADVEAVLLITTDLGPYCDDMCLAVRFNAEAAVFIMSEHPCYKAFLFDQLGKELSLDYNQIIEAASCIDNHIFVLYQRK